MKKIKKISIFSVLILSTFLLSACGGDNSGEVTLPIEKIQEINKGIEKQNEAIQDNTDKINFYKTYITDLLDVLSPEQLEKIIENEWDYRLSVNNVDFPKSGIMEISDTSFEMILTEKRVKYSVLSESDSVKRKFPHELERGLKIPKDISEPSLKKHSDIHSVLTSQFKDVEEGSIIRIPIDSKLQDIMGFETNELQIIIKSNSTY